MMINDTDIMDRAYSIVDKVNTIDTPDMAAVVSQLETLNDNTTAIIQLIMLIIGVVIAIGMGYVIYKIFKIAMI